jgi:dipeptidyl aminopeptidase/acylaminoacyl peptidase
MTDRDLAQPVRHPFAARLAVLLLGLSLLGAPPALLAQASGAGEDEALRLLMPDDYGDFETLGATVLSPDGGWLAATVGRVEGDGTLRIHRTDSDSTVTIPNGSRAQFTADGRWVAVAVAPGEEERRRLQGQGRPIRNDLLLLDLASGEEIRRPEVSTWSFSDDGGFLLQRRYRAGNNNNGARGGDVVIRDMRSGVELVLGNVAEAEWHDELPLLAMIFDAEGRAGNGVRLYDAASGTLRTLHAQEARFSNLLWRSESTDLAVFRETPDTSRGDTLQAVLAWRDVHDGEAAFQLHEGAFIDGDRELRVTSFRGLRWSDDGARLFFAAVPREPAEEEALDVTEGGEAEDAEASTRESDAPRRPSGAARDSVPGLAIWHALDVDPVPQQRLRAAQTRRQSELVAWEPAAGRSVVLGGREGDTSISLLPGQERALILDGRPYARERMFGPVYRDLHVVDVATGDRETVLERIEFYNGASPDGRYLLFFRDDHWHALDLREGRTANLTAELPAVFVNEAHDHTVEQRRPHGTGGWMEGEDAVLLYDEYDVWRVAPDGSGGERLTRGADDEVRHRVVRLDFDSNAFAPDEPIYLSLYGEWTKDSGYAQLHPDGRVETLIYEASSISRLAKADEAERHTFVSQRYDRPPTLHYVNPSFADARPVVQVNRHVAETYHWGRAELVDYENEWGVRLQGALFYPADYEPGRRYPMIVYPYERRSQVLHSWSNPSERSAYNTTVFTQNGYFVLQPDVVYRPRNPGLSFMEAVIPALDAVLETGMIDPDRIGLTGHSWGGYQTTFAVTQTDRFAAAVAGAPLTNLISMYLSFYWNTGGTDARIFEMSQGRMEVPWWEDYDSYRANSPVHHIQAMNTPLLMAFGTEDGAVEFNQGVEFYNAARRAEKDFVLLVYEGENHSLQQRANQIDYHRRTLEWFDHYLKGAPAPAWITEGVPWVEQEEKLKAGPAAGRVASPR